VRCSMLQFVAVCCSALIIGNHWHVDDSISVAVCRSVL